MYFEPPLERRRPMVTFGGKVLPSRRDDDGRVIGVTIHAGEQTYSVKDDIVGRELTGMVGTTVEVTGIVEEPAARTPTISVNDYFLARNY